MTDRTVRVGQVWSYQYCSIPATDTYEIVSISEIGLALGGCSVVCKVLTTSHPDVDIGDEYLKYLNIGNWHLEQDSDGEILWEGEPVQ